MDRFEYTTGQYQSNEYLVGRSRNVRLYDGDEKTNFENGELFITNLRIMWSHTNKQTVLSLSYSLITFIIIEDSHKKHKKRLIVNLLPNVKASNPGPVSSSRYDFIKLSFKDYIDENFVRAFDESVTEYHKILASKSATSTSNVPNIKLRTGIIGIERRISEKNKETDQSISVAFQDLSKLMVMAKDMVVLSKTISDKISNRQGDISEDETIKFKSYLLSLGIDDPVTRGSTRNENQYYENLAKEISKILVEPMYQVGGMMVLTDVYCRVNRARGLELLSPEDLLNACKMMDQLSLPLKLRVFESGVKVLQLLSHDDSILVEETASLLKEHSSLSAQELSTLVEIPLTLAKERLFVAEKFGKACRDESIEGLRFHVNLFLDLEE